MIFAKKTAKKIQSPQDDEKLNPSPGSSINPHLLPFSPQSSAFYLQRKLRGMDEKVDKHVDRVERQVVVCDSIVNDLLEYTRGKHVEKSAGEINPWIAEVLDQMAQLLGLK